MRRVSETYKQHIHDPVGGAIFMQINIGLINQEAQNNANVTSGLNYLSDRDIFNRKKIEIPYASYEHNFFKVDGAMIFPVINSNPTYFNGVITEKLSGENGNMDGEFIDISFPSSVLPLDIKGLTIQFKYFYPLEFDIEWGDNKQTFKNENLTFSTDFIFQHITDCLRIVPKRMNDSYCRLRIENIKFGIGLEFTNNDLLNCNIETYVHPVSNTLSYKNLDFKVIDYSGEYDLENPKSSINYMELLQDVGVRMGVELPNKSIEWLKMESLKLSEWVSENGSASFKAKDILSFNNNKYIRGHYHPNGITLYDLAVDVLSDIGLQPTDYYIDGYLRTITTKNPLPMCMHQEALQIIANAGHSYVSQDQDGKIFILNNFVPNYEITSSNKTSYANLRNVKDGTATEYYATFENSIIPIDGSIHNKPINPPYVSKIGYVSNSLSGVNGEFAEPPVIKIVLDARMKTFGLFVKFGLSTCTKFKVQTYLEDRLVETLDYDNENKEFMSKREWKEFDRMDISLMSVEFENQRAYIDYIKFGDITDYYISNNEYIQKPSKGKLNTVVKNFVVGALSYAKVDAEESLVDKDVIYDTGQEEETITFNDPVYGLRCDGATIIESGTYFVKLKKPKVISKTTIHITVFGKKYNISTSDVAYKINDKGIDQSFNNPLIDDVEKAYNLAKWISEDYLRENKDYAFDWRGDPAVEANDIVYIENSFIPKMQLRIMKNNISFDSGTFRGNIEGRKVMVK